MKFNKTKLICLIIVLILLISIPMGVLANSDDLEEVGIFALILLAGPAFYIYVYAKYSGKDKRHKHEEDTVSVVTNLEKSDELERRVKRSRTRSIGSYTFSNEGGGVLDTLNKKLNL